MKKKRKLLTIIVCITILVCGLGAKIQAKDGTVWLTNLTAHDWICAIGDCHGPVELYQGVTTPCVIDHPDRKVLVQIVVTDAGTIYNLYYNRHEDSKKYYYTLDPTLSQMQRNYYAFQFGKPTLLFYLKFYEVLGSLPEIMNQGIALKTSRIQDRHKDDENFHTLSPTGPDAKIVFEDIPKGNPLEFDISGPSYGATTIVAEKVNGVLVDDIILSHDWRINTFALNSWDSGITSSSNRSGTYDVELDPSGPIKFYWAKVSTAGSPQNSNNLKALKDLNKNFKGRI